MRSTPSPLSSAAYFASCEPLVVSVSSLSAPLCKMARQRGEQRHDAAAHQRLAAGQAQLADALGDEGAAQPVEFLQAQEVGLGQEGHVLRHAIDAAEIAAVGHRHAQIGDGALKRIDQRRRPVAGAIESANGNSVACHLPSRDSRILRSAAGHIVIVADNGHGVHPRAHVRASGALALRRSGEKLWAVLLARRRRRGRPRRGRLRRLRRHRRRRGGGAAGLPASRLGRPAWPLRLGDAALRLCITCRFFMIFFGGGAMGVSSASTGFGRNLVVPSPTAKSFDLFDVRLKAGEREGDVERLVARQRRARRACGRIVRSMSWRRRPAARIRNGRFRAPAPCRNDFDLNQSEFLKMSEFDEHAARTSAAPDNGDYSVHVANPSAQATGAARPSAKDTESVLAVQQAARL